MAADKAGLNGSPEQAALDNPLTTTSAGSGAATPAKPETAIARRNRLIAERKASQPQPKAKTQPEPSNDAAPAQDESTRWNAIPMAERVALAQSIGRKGEFATKLAANKWDRLAPEIQAKLRDAMGPAQADPEVGPFGPILTQYRGDAQGAIQALTELQDGEAVAALNHPEVGDIDLVWGEAPDGKREGFGLAKIGMKHPEVLADLQGFISSLTKVENRSGANRIRLVDSRGEAVVSLDWKGDRKVWLLTAYEKGAEAGTTMDTASNGSKGDTARLGPGAESSVTPANPDAQGAAPKPATKIDDFGEKLTGARKDYATQLKDAMEVDVAAEPLSKSWPEPDYQKLLDGGADAGVVAMVRAMRDEVPTKPQAPWKLKGWVDKAKTLRQFSQDLLDGTQSHAKLRAEMERQPQLRNQVLGRADLYEAVGHGKSLKGITFQQHHYSVYRGETNVTKWAVEQAAKATAMSNWPREIAVADTKDAALALFKERYDGLSTGAKAKGKASFTIYRKRNTPGVFIGKRIGREYIDLHKADDVAAARKHLEENTQQLEEALERYKDTPYERNAQNAPRVGDDHRNGALVTPEVFAQTFGFRGVQFGNYVEQGRRQSDLNEAFDALMDMAAVLELPPRALSLNGRLGLAFGARGKGGKGAPAAHYESGNVVINLTKGGGPGSLAHEWFHAMDNYFAKEAGEAGYMTAGAAGDKLRTEMRAAFHAIKRAVLAGSLQTRSMELDKRKTKAYWSTPVEMSARSFESYIISKLQDQSAANDYLANVIDEKAWQVAEDMRAEFVTGQKAAPTYPYPTVDELPALRAAFDSFFKTVQTKEDDAGNVAMFSRGESAKGIDRQAAQNVVDLIKARWANAPEIVVVANMQDAAIPEAVRADDAEQRSQGASGEPEGFFYDGKVYVVAGALNKPADVVRVLFHESLGHYGLRGVFGDALTPILKQLAALRRADVAARAKSYGLNMNKEAERLQAAEEVLAFLAQTNPQAGYVQRAIGTIRAFLRKSVPGFANMKLTDNDIITQFILPARRFVEGGQAAAVKRSDGPASAFSKAEANALEELSRADDLFAVPKSDKKTIEGVLADLLPKAKVKRNPAVAGYAEYGITLEDGSKATITVRPSNPYGESVYGFDLDANGEMENMVTGRPGENPEDVGAIDDVWVNVAGLKPGSRMGEVIYSAAGNFAFNTGRIFVGDPAGLTDAALRRRTEQMISSALKFGTTEHLAPHPYQTTGSAKLGVPALKWVYGDHVGNIERMIDVGLKALENAGLNLSNIAYDDASGNFVSQATGRPIPRGVLAGRARADRRGGNDLLGKVEAGWRTVARNALFGHLKAALSVDPGNSQRDGILDRLRDVSAGLGRDPGTGRAREKEDRIFYSRSSESDGDGLTTKQPSPPGDKISQFDLTGKPANVLKHYRGMAMQALGRRQLVDLFSSELPQLQAYNELVQAMDAEKNDTGAEADGLAQAWGKLDGDTYLRTLLIAGARAVVARAERSSWITRLLERRHYNVVVVALANKMARTAWAVLAKGAAFDQAPVRWNPLAPVSAS